MNYVQALAEAIRQAKRQGCWLYVFYDGEGEYGVRNEFDCETWWGGQEPLAAVSPEGEVSK